VLARHLPGRRQADRNDDTLTCEEVLCMAPVQAHAPDGAALLQKNA
jgi:hypothetical protein